MSTLYFDLRNGISGDMAVAALLGLGTPVEELADRLKPLGIGGYRVELALERRSGILGGAFSVIATEPGPSRNYGEIRSAIERSGLRPGEKSLAIAVFERLAGAESRVHGVPVDKVHFHEIGAIDSIVDVVSFAILYEKYGFSSAMASPVALGSGVAESMHGTIPVPAPATLEIVKDLVVTGTGAEHELTTPTGAAIVRAVVGRFGPLPECVIRDASMGYGKRRTGGLKPLRLFVIDEAAGAAASNAETAVGPGRIDARWSRTGRAASDHTVAVIDVTIDDSTPAEIGFLTEELMAGGALDAYVTPVYMKKNRPAFNVTIVCAPEDFERCALGVLEKSSSLGLRYQYYNRRTLERKIVKVETRFGPIAVKVGTLDGRSVKASPEYEDCRAAARASGTSLRRVYREAEEAWRALEAGE